MSHKNLLSAAFLAAVGLMAATGLAQNAPVLGNAAAEKLGWRVAVHSYTFKNFTIDQAIENTAKTGAKFMSISGGLKLEEKGKPVGTTSLTDAQFKAIQDKMVACGLNPNFVNMGVVSLDKDEAKARPVFEAAKRLGIGILIAEPKTEAMDTVDKLAQEYNIKVAIHNHPKPSFYWDPQVVLAALKGRSPMVGACADVGHWVRSGLNPLDCLKLYEGRLMVLHFKDLVPSEDHKKFHDVPWGTGNSNIKGMLAELKRQNFHGALCVEYEFNWDNSTPEIAECVKFFNATCEELVAAK